MCVYNLQTSFIGICLVIAGRLQRPSVARYLITYYPYCAGVGQGIYVYHFLAVFGMTRRGRHSELEPSLPGLVVSNNSRYPMAYVVHAMPPEKKSSVAYAS